ncbi:MAG: sodium/solute symporter [Phycisphaerae bacterium]|nr:sodium/solute symporter [Phycisphaerae bacterium]
MFSDLLAAGANSLNFIDKAVLVLYLDAIVGIGCWAGIRSRKGKEEGGKDYFLAGGSLRWPMIGLALFSTNISTIHLVGFAEEGYKNGLVAGNFEWMAPFLLIVLALFFAPFYIRSRVATLPDFLERRYSRSCRDWLAFISIISAIFIHIGFTLYTGAVVLRGLFGIPIMYSIVGATLLTGLYTIIGGLMAVVVTESIQTVVLLIGSIILTTYGLIEIGGWDGIVQSVDPVKLTVLRPASDPAGYPWYSIFLGYPVIGLWYWCADQTIVQRVLGAKDENHARVGPLFAGFIKVLPVFIFVLPGVICLGLIDSKKLDDHDWRNIPVANTVMVDGKEISVDAGRVALSGKEVKLKKASVNIEKAKTVFVENRPIVLDDGTQGTERVLVVDGRDQKDTEDTYAFMIKKFLPTGLTGVMAAALLAALMSTVSGALNSIATLFSYDLYRRWKPDTSDKKLVLIGRIATFVAMIIAIIWSNYIGHFEGIYKGCVSMISYIAPPITAVFLLGVFWKGASGKGAIVTLIVGSVLGFIVFMLAWFKESTGWTMPALLAGFYLCMACIAIHIVVSKLSPHKHTEDSLTLVWENPLDCLKAAGWRGIGDYRILAGLLFVTMVTLYIIFA